jgi:hypothetical protein
LIFPALIFATPLAIAAIRSAALNACSKAANAKRWVRSHWSL